MLSVDEALAHVLKHAEILPAGLRALVDLPGLVLAEDVVCDIDAPPFDKALMDGYALRTADVPAPGTVLRVGEEIPAGRVATRPLAPGEAAVIMTGAPLPEGADAVIQHERTERVETDSVRIDAPIRVGLNILPRGREMRAGEHVLGRGTTLSATHVGLIASVGRPEVLTISRPRVVVVPTGDELVEPGQVPGPGQIRNSHAVMLGALARQYGADAEVAPIAPDEPTLLREALTRPLASADIVLVTGGVSAGGYDLVPAALADLGVETIFHKIRLKPGKPLLFGIRPPAGQGPPTLVFGMPGNPVSGLVGFHLFVRPALDVLGGRSSAAPRRLRSLPLAAPFSHRGDRPTYYPAVVETADDREVLRTLGWAGSADLRTAALADGFAVFPPGDRDFESGDPVPFLPNHT